MVPSPKYRSEKNLVPQTMILSDKLQKDDLLCVTASHLELIYASNIDNFFGIVSIWNFQVDQLNQSTVRENPNIS